MNLAFRNITLILKCPKPKETPQCDIPTIVNCKL